MSVNTLYSRLCAVGLVWPAHTDGRSKITSRRQDHPSSPASQIRQLPTSIRDDIKMSVPAHSAVHARNYVDPEDEAAEKAKKEGEPPHSKGMVSENKEESC
jgi:hypothetical protein